MIVSIGLVQLALCDDSDLNFAKALDRIRQAAERGAQIVCLPELFRSLHK